MILKDELMIDVIRSGSLESQYIGSIAVVDFNGKLLARVGNPLRRSFMRSSVKPVQALPLFMDDGCMKHFKFTMRERAYLMSSHNAERRHQAVGTAIQKKIGVTNKDMGCGIHPPAFQDTAYDMLRKGEEFTPLCNNCSGNHLAMLSLSVYRGWDISDYINPEHPYQKEVLKWLGTFTGIPASRIRIGIDNCSVPAYNLTLQQMALVYARMSAPGKFDSIANPYNLDFKKASEVIKGMIDDFWANPDMIGGTNRLCTYLNKVGKGVFWSKAGAEGMQLVGFVDHGIGMALKIVDGDRGTRAKPTATIEALRQLGFLSDADIKKAGNLYMPEIPNLRGFDAQIIMPRLKFKKTTAWLHRFS